MSLQVSALSVLILTLITIPLAWALSRSEFRGKRLLLSVMLLPLVLPPTGRGYYLVVLFGTNGIIGSYLFHETGLTLMFSWWGAVVAAMVVAFPLQFQTTYLAMSLVPHEMEDTAYTLGASKWQALRYVTLPLAKRGVLVGLALAFARSMGEFGATLMLAGNIPGRTVTVPLAIYNAFSAGRLSEANILVIVYTALNLLVLIYVFSWGREGIFKA